MLVGGLVALAGIFFSNKKVANPILVKLVIIGIGVLGVVWGVYRSSVFYVPDGKAGLLYRGWGGKPLPSDRIIAANGENGKQAATLSPGYHFMWFYGFQYDVTYVDEIVVPAGKVFYLKANDGAPLPDGHVAAAPFGSDAQEMLFDPAYFLLHGGQKGFQTTLLTPGTYRLNTYLWDVQESDDDCVETVVPQGTVGVINSAIHGNVDMGALKATAPADDSTIVFHPDTNSDSSEEQVRASIVPVGAIGIWAQVLPPGQYFINRKVYKVTLVPVTIQKFEYKGGWTKRSINLSYNNDGTVIQTPVTEDQAKPTNAADVAIIVKCDNFDIPVELRAEIQIAPEDAPFVVSTVIGNQATDSSAVNQLIEDKLITPAIRNAVRTVGGMQNVSFETDSTQGGTNVTTLVVRAVVPTDFIEQREVLQREIRTRLNADTLRVHIHITQVQIGEAGVPPELLLPKRLQEIAQQMITAYQTQQQAQQQRQQMEQASATANGQKIVVDATLQLQASALDKQKLQNEGEGQELQMEAVAKGQKAQLGVLGENAVFQLALVDKLIQALSTNPQLLQVLLQYQGKMVPNTVITIGKDGNGNSLASASAIFGTLLNNGKGVVDTNAPSSTQ